MKIAMILLASGNSQRFGSNKLLFEINGKPMYQNVMVIFEQIAKENSNILPIVVTQYEEIYNEAKKRNMKAVMNREAYKGISNSIKLGIEFSENADAWLFSVSDQPWLKYETVKSLLQFFEESSIGIACIAKNGRFGNPCVFAKKYKNELMDLSGDSGGKKVLKNHKDDLLVYEINNEKEMEDIDYMNSVTIK